MKVYFAAALALALSGCASIERPQMHVVTRAKPIVTTPDHDQPATFKQRWQEFKKKHPIKWTHK